MIKNLDAFYEVAKNKKMTSVNANDDLYFSSLYK